jgi:hypothetical protein
MEICGSAREAIDEIVRLAVAVALPSDATPTSAPGYSGAVAASANTKRRRISPARHRCGACGVVRGDSGPTVEWSDD